ncbi:hypothetical protein HPB48_021642 [Haemaphysalis longicornis]|uniref:Uncharacterized protein n=1 Tax=Haemaphysalis longicornis TaxID=44386 RepID=A0A9J6F9K1_HAELO|nr:hypothetical protein HPB48_021642 [Haemaphysalis longicornis]
MASIDSSIINGNGRQLSLLMIAEARTNATPAEARTVSKDAKHRRDDGGIQEERASRRGRNVTGRISGRLWMEAGEPPALAEPAPGSLGAVDRRYGCYQEGGCVCKDNYILGYKGCAHAGTAERRNQDRARARGGLHVPKTGLMEVTEAVFSAADVAEDSGSGHFLCVNTQQYIVVNRIAMEDGSPDTAESSISKSTARNTRCEHTGQRRTAESRGESCQDIDTSIASEYDPLAFAAKSRVSGSRSNATTVIVVYEGTKVPSYVRQWEWREAAAKEQQLELERNFPVLGSLAACTSRSPSKDHPLSKDARKHRRHSRSASAGKKERYPSKEGVSWADAARRP